VKKLLDLFIVFARIGGLTFGGGYAMLPILQREAVEKRQWVSQEEMMDYYAISQCTPGIIAANTANFIGTHVSGAAGGVAATLGVITPSIIIITIIAAFLTNFADLPVVQNAFAGIRVCVCILIINAIIKLWKRSVVNIGAFIIFLVIFAGSLFLDISPILYVVLAAAAGIAITLIGRRSAK